MIGNGVMISRRGRSRKDGLAYRCRPFPFQGGPAANEWQHYLVLPSSMDLAHSYMVGENRQFIIVHYDYINDGLRTFADARILSVISTSIVDDPKNLNRVPRAIDARFTNSFSRYAHARLYSQETHQRRCGSSATSA